MSNPEVKQNQQNVYKASVIPHTFKEYIMSFGPGIVMVLSWLGAGDIVDSSSAGASYGYALMWYFALVLLIRWILVNIIAKYTLCNQVGDDNIVKGYSRIHPIFAAFLGVCGVVYGHLLNSYMIKGAGNSIYALTGHTGSIFIWSLVVMIAGLWIGFGHGKKVYAMLENVMKVILILMTVSFFIAVVKVGCNWGAFFKGLFTPQIPASTGGLVGTWTFMASLLASAGGSVCNLLYPYFLKEKGWNKPEFRKVQVYDLLLGIIMMIVLNLAIWIIGAEIMNPVGGHVKSLDDLVNALSSVIGPIGGTLIWLGVFGATFSSYLGLSFSFLRLTMDSVFILKPEREKKYGVHDKDPLWKPLVVLIMICPIIWALPSMPGFVYLTLLNTALQIFVLPIIFIGIFILTNKKELMPDKYRNKWWENTVLVMMTGFSLMLVFNMAKDLFL